MDNGEDWITSAITKVKGQGATAPDVVWTRLEALLRGKFSERPMPAKELADLAMRLIDGTSSPSPIDEESQ